MDEIRVAIAGEGELTITIPRDHTVDDLRHLLADLKPNCFRCDPDKIPIYRDTAEAQISDADVALMTGQRKQSWCIRVFCYCCIPAYKKKFMTQRLPGDSKVIPAGQPQPASPNRRTVRLLVGIPDAIDSVRYYAGFRLVEGALAFAGVIFAIFILSCGYLPPPGTSTCGDGVSWIAISLFVVDGILLAAFKVFGHAIAAQIEAAKTQPGYDTLN